MTKRHDRTLWLNPRLDDYREGEGVLKEVLVPCSPKLPGLEDVTPNLVSSRLSPSHTVDPYGSVHSPVLDLDFEASLIPSSTPGHYHLYLDGMTMRWDRYRSFLRSMANYGVIEQRYYEACVRRSMSCVRVPGLRKGEGASVWGTD